MAGTAYRQGLVYWLVGWLIVGPKIKSILWGTIGDIADKGWLVGVI